MSKTMKAGDLSEGAYLPGLSNGYVTEVEGDERYSIRSGDDYPYVVPPEFVLVTLTDPVGNDFYLLCPRGMEVEVGDE